MTLIWMMFYLKRGKSKIWLTCWTWNFNLLQEKPMYLLIGGPLILGIKAGNTTIILAGLIWTKITISKPSKKYLINTNSKIHLYCTFFHFSCQFVVKADGDYTVYLADPDLLVPWESIEQIVSIFKKYLF